MPSLDEQRKIVAGIDTRRGVILQLRRSLIRQLEDIGELKDKIIHEIFTPEKHSLVPLGQVLLQQTRGIGTDWANYPVYGATRRGLALAKEKVGKHGERYKPIHPSTVFYNPMRILLGSIAMLPDSGQQGITSPDYVVVISDRDKLDALAFYEWFRGPYGRRMILDLARGAVRERILFPRLAKGTIPLPKIAEQRTAAQVLIQANHIASWIEMQLLDIETLDQAVLCEAFE